ncbi:MAG: hypothetical protein AB1714_09570 [Acidobacteriota bacterium]
MRSRTPSCIRVATIALTGLFISMCSSLVAEDNGVEMRYDLRAGDHFVYRERTERTSHGTDSDFEYVTLTQCTAHVLVVSASDSHSLVAVQRGDIRSELVQYTEEGVDLTESERTQYAESLGPRLVPRAEVNRVDAHGWPALAWAAIREVTSEFLPCLHEIEGLPNVPVNEGSSWKGVSSLDLTFRWVGRERIGDADCIRVEGTGPLAGVSLVYWHCPSSGLLQRLEYTGAYPVPHARVSEKWTAELLERTRGEDPQTWLARADTRIAVLESCMLEDALPATPAALYPLLDSGDIPTQQAVLSLAYARRFGPPATTQLVALARSPDPLVRRLAVRMLETVPKDDARAIIELSIKDIDPFMGEAVLQWARGRLSVEQRGSLGTPPDVLRRYELLSRVPLPEQSRAEGVATSAVEQCLGGDQSGGMAGGTARIVPGTTLRPMASPGYQGWPYILHIPADYRGDAPFPLVICMSGGPGRARMGLVAFLNIISRTGYVVLFPQARESWWEEWTGAMVENLVKEVEGLVRIDPNRVCAVGWSNGGTGAFALATQMPQRLAAAVSLEGAGVFVPWGAPPAAGNTDNVPLLFIHGERDTTIDCRATRQTVDRLRQLRRFAPVEMRILEGRGHDISIEGDGELFFPFLRKHVRDPFPRRIEFELGTLAFPRHYWVRIEEKGQGVANVSGEIREDNTIVVTARNVQAMRLLLRPELLAKPSAPVRVIVNGKPAFEGPLQFDCELLKRTTLLEADRYLAYSAELSVRIAQRKGALLLGASTSAD